MSGRKGLSTWCNPKSCGDGILKDGPFTLLLGSCFVTFFGWPADCLGTCGMHPVASSVSLKMAGALGLRAATVVWKAFALTATDLGLKAISMESMLRDATKRSDLCPPLIVNTFYHWASNKPLKKGFAVRELKMERFCKTRTGNGEKYLLLLTNIIYFFTFKDCNLCRVLYIAKDTFPLDHYASFKLSGSKTIVSWSQFIQKPGNLFLDQ